MTSPRKLAVSHGCRADVAEGGANVGAGAVEASTVGVRVRMGGGVGVSMVAVDGRDISVSCATAVPPAASVSSNATV